MHASYSRLCLCRWPKHAHKRAQPVSAPESVVEGDGGLPAELLEDQLVVAVPATHALGAGDVLDGQVLLVEGLNHLHHVVHGDHLGASQVERLLEVRLGDAQDALHAVVDEGEGARLHAVAPHLDLVRGSEDLAGQQAGRSSAGFGEQKAAEVDFIASARSGSCSRPSRALN